eukprot:TRINITY_DN3793_c0_g1_i1.p1 TRINITY_DN3793_c0_g1~~TRINITY_DN3793_c0_g1_i1.p1  ORF type:complete len:196 (-),score=40.25 TRINITY_DN3793_c0_g1_i1:260-847(-)
MHTSLKIASMLTMAVLVTILSVEFVSGVSTVGNTQALTTPRVIINMPGSRAVPTASSFPSFSKIVAVAFQMGVYLYTATNLINMARQQRKKQTFQRLVRIPSITERTIRDPAPTLKMDVSESDNQPVPVNKTQEDSDRVDRFTPTIVVKKPLRPTPSFNGFTELSVSPAELSLRKVASLGKPSELMAADTFSMCS